MYLTWIILGHVGNRNHFQKERKVSLNIPFSTTQFIFNFFFLLWRKVQILYNLREIISLNSLLAMRIFMLTMPLTQAKLSSSHRRAASKKKYSWKRLITISNTASWKAKQILFSLNFICRLFDSPYIVSKYLIYSY